MKPIAPTAILSAAKDDSRAAVPSLWRLAWPIFGEHLLHVATNVVATLMVGHISDAAVGGLGSAGQVLWMLMMVFGALAIGASTVISHHLGRGDAEGARRLAGGAVATSLWLGLVLGLALLPAAPWLLRLVQLPPGPMSHALPYLQWMAGTLFLESMNFGLSAALRAHGATRAVMTVMALQNAVNAAGIAFALHGPWAADTANATGVALASVASRAVACALLWHVASSRLGLKLKWSDLWAIRGDDLRRLLSFGIPGTLQNASWFGAFMVVTALSARLGEVPLATQNYVMQVASLVILFSAALSQASELRVGRFVGAGLRREAFDEALSNLRRALMLAMLASVVSVVVGPRVLAAFTVTPEVLASGTLLLWLGLLLEPGRAFNLVLGASLRAAGDVNYALRMGFLSQWGVMVGGSWLLGTALGFGLPGVWCAFIIDEWLRGLLLLRRWRRHRWVRAAVRSARAVPAMTT